MGNSILYFDQGLYRRLFQLATDLLELMVGRWEHYRPK